MRYEIGDSLRDNVPEKVEWCGMGTQVEKKSLGRGQGHFSHWGKKEKRTNEGLEEF